MENTATIIDPTINVNVNTSDLETSADSLLPTTQEIDLSIKRFRLLAKEEKKHQENTKAYIADIMLVTSCKEEEVQAKMLDQLCRSGLWYASLTGKAKGMSADTLWFDGCKARNLTQTLDMLRRKEAAKDINTKEDDILCLGRFVAAVGVEINRRKLEAKRDITASLPAETVQAEKEEKKADAIAAKERQEDKDKATSRLDVLEWTLSGIAGLCLNSKLSKKQLAEMIISALA